MHLLAELQRRNVIRMAGLYLVVAWLMVQVGATLLPVFEAPAWVMRVMVALLAVGFVPALVFSWVFELTPDGLKRDSAVPAEASIAPQTARRLDRAIIVVLALAVGYFAVDKFALAPARERAAAAMAVAAVREPQAPVQPAAAPATPGIAVLPLANEGGAADEQYFSDGLSENLITALSQFGGLKVIGRNSSFQFRGSSEDSTTIGRKLGVSHLLEGSVRRLGDTVRIHAALVRAADGSTVWSQRYDRPYTDLFALQDEITAAVAAALKAKIVDPALAGVQDDRPPNGDLGAYNAYLKGVFEAGQATQDSHARAFAAFREAIAREPRYAHAWAALANTQSVNAGLYRTGGELRAGMANARASIAQALALAPGSAYVNAVHAGVLMNGELRYVDAELAARRAVALSPTAATLSALGLARLGVGDAPGAEDLLRQALQLDPLASTSWFWLSITLASQGKLGEARAAADRNLELRAGIAPGLAQLAFVQVLSGDHAAALATAESMPDGNWKEIALAMTAQKAGDAARADRLLQALIDSSADGSAYQVAEIFAHRGEPDQVFAWLDRALANRDPGLRRLLTDPFIAPYRDDPRFADLCRRLGLPLPVPP